MVFTTYHVCIILFAWRITMYHATFLATQWLVSRRITTRIITYLNGIYLAAMRLQAMQRHQMCDIVAVSVFVSQRISRLSPQYPTKSYKVSYDLTLYHIWYHMYHSSNTHQPCITIVCITVPYHKWKSDTKLIQNRPVIQPWYGSQNIKRVSV